MQQLFVAARGCSQSRLSDANQCKAKSISNLRYFIVFSSQMPQFGDHAIDVSALKFAVVCFFLASLDPRVLSTHLLCNPKKLPVGDSVEQ